MIEALLAKLLGSGIAQLFTYVAQMGGLAAVAIIAIEYATRAKWVPWLTPETGDQAKRAVAAFAAAASAVGLSYTYDGAAEQLVIHGFSPTRLASVVIAVASQFGLQQVLFNLVVKRFMR